MARATRSTAYNLEKDREKAGEKEKEKEKEKDKSQTDPPNTSSRSKLNSKKRKRGSIPDTDEQPSVKQPRTDSTLKTEDGVDQEMFPTQDSTLPRLQNAGDLPIDPLYATKILDVLEMVDTQGLLDRVFPLPSESPIARPVSLSFRTLLRDSSQHPLSVLRSAVRHLLPISSHPRLRPSTPAAQQLGFCNLALSLLEEASFNSVPLPLDINSILPPPSSSSPDDDARLVNGDSKAPHTATAEAAISSRKRKYALMQRLPNGEWWTSLNSDNALSSSDDKELKDLHTAHAQLVTILPSESVIIHNDSVPSSSAKEVPTLRSFTVQKTGAPKSKLLGPRRISCGTFLDYGPYTSFAPSWDQDGTEIGRRVLGEVLWNSEEKKRKRKTETTEFRVQMAVASSERDDVVMHDDVRESPQREKNLKEEIDDSLEGLLLPEQIASFTSALGCLELECALQELLERNSKALQRLAQLQRERLSAENGGSSQAEEGSEEWDTAQEILNSLTLLASLRPRSSSDAAVPLIPPPSVLRQLYATLPLAHTRGWQGNIYSTRTTALRDDTTVRMRSGATVSASAATTTAANAATAAAPSTSTAASTSAYPNYSYSNYAASQYRSGYTPYKPGQTPTYYPTTYTATTGQSQSGTPSTYYTNPTYNPTGQQTYSYGSWYSYQPPNATVGTSSGRGTPQPATSGGATVGSTATGGTTALANNYAGFFNHAQSTTQRAVANTVISGKPVGMGGYVAPTLPPYQRNTVGTAVGSGGLHGQTSYYGSPD